MKTSHLEGRSVGITGGAGFIGSYLVEAVLEHQPSRLVVLDDFSTGTLTNLEGMVDRIELVEGDVCDPETARSLEDLDLVFHLAVRNVRASITDPGENLRVNAGGTQQVLEAMRRGRAGSFVYVSSSEVYGIPPDGTYRENSLPRPTTVYGAGKLAGEHLAIAYRETYGMETRVIRPFNNYGPRSHFEGDSGEVIPKFILRALAGQPLIVHGSGEQTRDFMFVAETARWLIALSGSDTLVGQIVNIGSGIETRIVDLAGMVLEKVGSQSPIVFGEPRPGDLPRLVAETGLARSVSGFELEIGLSDGLDLTIAHFRDKDIDAMLGEEVEATWI